MGEDLEKIDQSIAGFMNQRAEWAIRISFAIIFIWFGILKPLGHSEAQALVLATVSRMPFFEAETWLSIIGWWEILIGLFFLFPQTTRLAIALLFAQMGGTFLPLFVLPDITFQDGNYLLPTLVGQYIIKNLMLISAALVIGGRFYKKRKQVKRAA